MILGKLYIQTKLSLMQSLSRLPSNVSSKLLYMSYVTWYITIIVRLSSSCKLQSFLNGRSGRRSWRGLWFDYSIFSNLTSFLIIKLLLSCPLDIVISSAVGNTFTFTLSKMTLPPESINVPLVVYTLLYGK